MKICLANMKPVVGNKKKNLKKMERVIAAEAADMYVFGEMALTGYSCRDEFRELAEDADGPSINAVKKIASERSCHVVFGMPFKEREGVISNAAVMVHPDGQVNIYRKSFLANFGPFEEKFYFAPGDGMPIFETAYGKIGMCICYDLFFPELVKGLALKGADMIICISASPTTTQEFFEKVLPARAIENTTFIAYSNLVGTQENLVFWGGGQVYGPKGNLIARGKYLKEGAVTAEIDFSNTEEARASRPTLRDTKSELFSDLYRISKSEPLHSGYAVVGMKMGKYALKKMKVEGVTVHGRKDMIDVIDGIIFSTLLPRNRIKFEEDSRVSAVFSSGKKEIKIFLKDDVAKAIEGGMSTSVLNYVRDENIFEEQ